MPLAPVAAAAGKSVAAPLIGAAGSIGGALIGGITSLFGGKKTNDTSLKVARENNQFNAAEAEKARKFNSQEAALAREFNASEAEKQRAYNTAMYEKSLAWRSPANQIKLMQEAGLNPLNFQQGSVSDSAPTSSAASGPSASGPSASSAGLPQLRNPVDASAFSQIASALSDVKLKEAQANQADAVTLTENLTRNGKVELLNTQISMNIADTSLTKAEETKIGKELIKMDAEVNALAETVKKLQAETDFITFQARYQQLKGDEQAIINARLDERISEEIKSIKAARHLSEAQRKQVIEVTKGIIIENRFKPFTLQLGYDEVDANIKLTDAKRAAVNLQTKRPEPWYKVLPYINSFTDFTGIVGSVLGNARGLLDVFH